jgi:hypothetical protein
MIKAFLLSLQVEEGRRLRPQVRVVFIENSVEFSGVVNDQDMDNNRGNDRNILVVIARETDVVR